MNIIIKVSMDTGPLEKIIFNCESMPPNIVEEFAAEVESYAKGFAPVDTGALMNSIQWFMVGEATARIQPDVDYDIYQELGTYKMAAQPFLTPAIEAVAGRFLSESTWSPLINE